MIAPPPLHAWVCLLCNVSVETTTSVAYAKGCPDCSGPLQRLALGAA